MKQGIQNQIIKDRTSPKNKSGIISPSNKNAKTCPSTYLKGKMFGDLLISQQDKDRQSMTLHQQLEESTLLSFSNNFINQSFTQSVHHSKTESEPNHLMLQDITISQAYEKGYEILQNIVKFY